MLAFQVDGIELSIAVAALAVTWVFLSFVVYLLWYRFFKERVVKLTGPLYKAVMILAFAILVALLLFAAYFSLVHSSLEATYRFPADLTYKYLAG
jgi:hypothetical protein